VAVSKLALGLYIHVPFCVKKCSYCDFVSYPYDADLAASYVYALEKEMLMYKAALPESLKKVGTIYMGGGTPTCLPSGLVNKILEKCFSCFKVAADAEITIECNPGTVTYDKLKEIKEAGFNRISIGVQAYQKHLLATLGRIHGWQDVLDVAEWCHKLGLTNFNLDLIYGIPDQKLKDWCETLNRVVELSPSHISAYNLKLEPNTPLQQEVAHGHLHPLEEETELDMFWYTIDFLLTKGFIHYEISNFALAGFESKHNIIYWRNNEYLGLGPAAHSQINKSRFSNVENVELYINRLTQDKPVIEDIYSLTWEDVVSEAMFLGLRLMKGIDIKEFEKRYGLSMDKVFGDKLKKLKNLGLIELDNKRIRLSKKGLPLANEVFAEFI